MEKDPQWFENGERSCHRGITLDDRQIDVHIALGELYSLSSQDDKAIEYFDAALRVDPRAAEAEMKKGLSLENLGQIADAETALRAAVNKEQYYWRARNNLGRFLMRHARYEEAVTEFAAVTDLTPYSSSALNNLAAAHYMTGDQAAAIAAFDKSIEIEPGRSALMNTANLHYYRGEFDKAATRYEQAARLMPKDDRPLGGLAASIRFVPQRQRQVTQYFEEAAELAEELLMLAPSDSLAWARLASYRAYAGQRDKALAALERSDLAEATDVDVRFFACLTYMALGEQHKAVELLESLVQLGYTRDILMNDPDLAPIRGDARIVAALSAGE